MKIFAENRKARNSYDFTEYLEAGIVLTGSETKSIRNGGVSIVDAFAIIENEEAVIREMNIEQYCEEYDDLNAMISINAGAGGVDANDWAQILYRMYTRYFDENNMEYTIEELSNAEEAGIKSVSITVNSYRAYATLESERGVHRLVRISPFDSNKRRHTSFAGVDVIPLIEFSCCI